MMENFAIDLDKVLDELEGTENSSPHPVTSVSCDVHPGYLNHANNVTHQKAFNHSDDSFLTRHQSPQAWSSPSGPSSSTVIQPSQEYAIFELPPRSASSSDAAPPQAHPQSPQQQQQRLPAHVNLMDDTDDMKNDQFNQLKASLKYLYSQPTSATKPVENTTLTTPSDDENMDEGQADEMEPETAAVVMTGTEEMRPAEAKVESPMEVNGEQVEQAEVDEQQEEQQNDLDEEPSEPATSMVEQTLEGVEDAEDAVQNGVYLEEAIPVVNLVDQPREEDPAPLIQLDAFPSIEEAQTAEEDTSSADLMASLLDAPVYQDQHQPLMDLLELQTSRGESLADFGPRGEEATATPDELLQEASSEYTAEACEPAIEALAAACFPGPPIEAQRSRSDLEIVWRQSTKMERPSSLPLGHKRPEVKRPNSLNIIGLPKPSELVPLDSPAGPSVATTEDDSSSAALRPDRSRLTLVLPRPLAPINIAAAAAAESTEPQSSESAESVDVQPAEPTEPVEPVEPAESVDMMPTEPAPSEPQSVHAVLNSLPEWERKLGKEAPIWLPDGEAPLCMSCQQRFTITRRRHHCRACGKIFCSTCCNLKNRLPYMNSKEGRVCQPCHQTIVKVQSLERTAATTPRAPTLRKRKRNTEPKSVIFSDGIRPGNDLSEEAGASPPPVVPKRIGRSQRRVEASQESQSRVVRRIPNASGEIQDYLSSSAILPPMVLDGQEQLEFNPDLNVTMEMLRDESFSPVRFSINKNLDVFIKLVDLECCVRKLCWSVSTKGMCNVGQDEIVIILQYSEDDQTVPKDILNHLNEIYKDASKGNIIVPMGHTVIYGEFLGSKENSGFLFIRPTFQCLNKLTLPSPPYLMGILLQKWEIPWAKMFPLRLMLRLGAEYRYYPCPIYSVRDRPTVFYEIGHTIMNLLADFRNYQYTIAQIKGASIHMEDKKTTVAFPQNRYDDVMKALSNSNDHVFAIGVSFSMKADSHLVCLQNDVGNYQTQAINIQKKPRKVTGASFVVFNGSLKSGQQLHGKCSIIEDGIMVQMSQENFSALKQALKTMKEWETGCGPATAPPEEQVCVRWDDDDRECNIGVMSVIDDFPMDGVTSVRVHNADDYVADALSCACAIRWTEVFFLQTERNVASLVSPISEPVDLGRLAESLAKACCTALAGHLDSLHSQTIQKLALRVSIDAERVNYIVGANGSQLAEQYMADLDNELIPIIHGAAAQTSTPIVLELIFHIVRV